MKFFPGQGNVRILWMQGKFRSQEKVREFENKWLWQAVLRKFFMLLKRGKDVLSHEIM